MEVKVEILVEVVLWSITIARLILILACSCQLGIPSLKGPPGLSPESRP